MALPVAAPSLRGVHEHQETGVRRQRPPPHRKGLAEADGLRAVTAPALRAVRRSRGARGRAPTKAGRMSPYDGPHEEEEPEAHHRRTGLQFGTPQRT